MVIVGRYLAVLARARPCRPKFRNAFGRATTLEVDEAFTAAQNDDGVKVIVLNGAGEHFCSGHDLGTPQETNDPLVEQAKNGGFRGDYERWYSLDLEMCLKWRSIRKPVICAAKGYVVLGGSEVLLLGHQSETSPLLKDSPSTTEPPSCLSPTSSLPPTI